MRRKRGTAECEQCESARRMETECTIGDFRFWDTPKWEDEPCIDLKKQIGDVLISTVFLHHDHNFGSGDEPIFYETMIFGNVVDDCLGDEIYCNRYSSKKEAITRHNIIVSFLEKQTPEEFVAWIKLIREESAA